MTGEHPPYVRAAIDGEISRVATAQVGERNSTIFKAAAALASLGLKEGEIIRHLKVAADSTGIRGGEFYRTIKSGFKKGQANPRSIPESPAVDLRMFRSSRPDQVPLPARSQLDADGRQPAFIVAGEVGPAAASDELRRHEYRRQDKSVRCKIKRGSGYVNWYRVIDGETEGWQAGKPDGYVPCPYVGAVNPFVSSSSGRSIYWPEGEKDCDTLGRVGLGSFTFGGTGDGLPDGILEYLVGHEIVILADNDIAGRDHARKKARLAHAVASSVRIVNFPELTKGADVSDYLQGSTVDDLERRVKETPLWLPEAGIEKSSEAWRNATITANSLKEKKFEPVKYVLPGFITEGVTVFAGKPKIGKSWLLYDVCLASAAGRFVLGNIKPAEGQVLYLALEDSQRRLKQRLQKLWPDGSWPESLTLATEWRRADAGGLDDIASWCRSVTKPILIVIDTLEKFRPVAKGNAPAYSTDYSAITGLHKLAHSLGIAVVVVHHVRKMEADDPFDTVSGTTGLTGAADTILILKRQSGNVTLHARGRDIEESETACTFNKVTCRWTLLGEAAEVHTSGQRVAIVSALKSAGSAGMHVTELMAAIGRSDRNAVDQLLFKMSRDGDVVRLKRGVYAEAGKIDKKERFDAQGSDQATDSANLTDLTNLTAGLVQ
jgi:hypothetical protein